ncbi:hypothetical protein ACQ4M4_16360 [Leptolyngbya sp. AN02str]|uniref:hypothetical protein n=1 Tax=Leptolyngbya sp. AN02str TaxID=3423363 RepID=UPI003D322DC6
MKPSAIKSGQLLPSYNKSGEQWWLTSLEEAAASQIRELYQVQDSWREAIALYVEDKDCVSTSEILKAALEIDLNKQDQVCKHRVANVLTQLEWEPCHSPKQHKGRKQRVWRRRTHQPKENLEQSSVPTVPSSSNVENTIITGDTSSGTVELQQSVPSSVLPEDRMAKAVQPSGTVGTVTSSTTFHVGDRVAKKGVRGWTGNIEKLEGESAYLKWYGDNQASWVSLSNLEHYSK